MRKHINKVILIVVNVLITPIHNSCFASRNLYSALSSVFTNMTHGKKKQFKLFTIGCNILLYRIVFEQHQHHIEPRSTHVLQIRSRSK